MGSTKKEFADDVDDLQTRAEPFKEEPSLPGDQRIAVLLYLVDKIDEQERELADLDEESKNAIPDPEPTQYESVTEKLFNYSSVISSVIIDLVAGKFDLRLLECKEKTGKELRAIVADVFGEDSEELRDFQENFIDLL